MNQLRERSMKAYAALAILLSFAISLAGCGKLGSVNEGGGDAADDDGADDSADDTAQDDTSPDDDQSDDSNDDAQDDDDDTYAPPDGMQTAVYDVGQGDSILLRFPLGSTMLVDGGPNYSGEDVILPAFHALHLESLDFIVATHPDADHCGGLDEVVEAVTVGEVWENGQTKDTAAWNDFSDAVDADGIPRVTVHRGDDFTIDGCDVLVINAYQGWSDVNANSIVMSVDCEDAVFLLTGDATEQTQDDLISVYGGDLESDVVKVPHHGSPDRAPDFADAVSPSVAVISVGPNSYGHPNADVIDEWETAGATVYRTDQDGSVVITAKDGLIQVETNL